MSVVTEIKEIISNHLGIPLDEVDLDAYLQDDLNADPLTLADLIVSLEDKFKIEIPPSESHKFEKVEDVVNYIADKIGEI